MCVQCHRIVNNIGYQRLKECILNMNGDINLQNRLVIPYTVYGCQVTVVFPYEWLLFRILNDFLATLKYKFLLP